MNIHEALRRMDQRANTDETITINRGLCVLLEQQFVEQRDDAARMHARGGSFEFCLGQHSAFRLALHSLYNLTAGEYGQQLDDQPPLERSARDGGEPR
ncbi:MAG TPA: hypothetical protein VGX25_03895 [Actinophytocola sp.]|uniref:hypothetical protein n=1 Tax=Actinophytocola sp. TaxID=1872138 RepID=UPI002DDCF85E|nr:hypothetical protein [Actinophytocola sp.]HEV2778520.1 hypothetical protein [Actinophytocola sp.]